MNKKQLTEAEINLNFIKFHLFSAIFLSEMGKKPDMDKLDCEALLFGINVILDKALSKVEEMENTK